GRELLRKQLAHRGVTLSAGALATVLAALAAPTALPAAVLRNTVRASRQAATGKAVADFVSPPGTALAEGEKVMLLARAKSVVALLVTLAVLTAGVCVRPLLSANNPASPLTLPSPPSDGGEGRVRGEDREAKPQARNRDSKVEEEKRVPTD